MLDEDNNGKIDIRELFHLVAGNNFEEFYTKVQLADVIRAVDQDGDDEVDFNEFMAMMSGA